MGKTENKKAFVQSQTGFYPDLSTWEMESEKQEELLSRINKAAAELSESFAKQERLALVRQEMDSLLLEMQYFDQYCRETGLVCSEIMPRHRLKSETLMGLWQECYGFSEKDRAVSFWFKIKSAFIYGISNWRYYSRSLTSIITLLQNLFYQAKKTELENETGSLETYLKSVDAKAKMDRLTADSMDYLRAKIFDRFGGRTERKIFSEDDLWKNAGEVVKEYPVVISTTFSSLSSLRGVTYDYLIMDEASQVDVATGALSLSCTQNAVIVGDLKQLPNVVGDEMRKRSDAVFRSYKLPRGYSFSENSFLKSVCSVLPDVPQTLLREHYRCHPKIIGFCNQKFYQNELIIMTEDHSEPDTLGVFKTAAGNHRRGHVNQRQIDVTLREALPVLKDSRPEDIGIVAPYKDQVSAIAGQLHTDKIEVHTVHKFQGREKDTIVLTTVDDVISDFSDDPYLLNVAVSRAKKRLILVASGNEQPEDSNIGDLISYIEYNNFQVVESQIYSVFDLLYQQYTAARIAYLKKHAKVSSFDSENLMYGAIMDLIEEHPDLTLNVICHQPLHMLIRYMARLNDEERRYLANTATHLDFLIYNKISKKPVLAIEVDGFHFHKPGTLQYERDKIKDRILTLYDIPFFRFPTNGSGEMERIRGFLEEYEKHR